MAARAISQVHETNRLVFLSNSRGSPSLASQTARRSKGRSKATPVCCDTAYRTHRGAEASAAEMAECALHPGCLMAGPAWLLIPNWTSLSIHSEAPHSPTCKPHLLLNKHKLGDNDIHLFSLRAGTRYSSQAYGISISCHVPRAFELSEKLHLLAPVYTAGSYRVN